jgi:hypothetical protein
MTTTPDDQHTAPFRSLTEADRDFARAALAATFARRVDRSVIGIYPPAAQPPTTAATARREP